MKTTKTLTLQKSTFTFLSLFFALFFFSSIAQAQEITVKGIVKGNVETEIEPLMEASVYLKGTNFATTTNKKGEFTFPKKLKKGDILVFSYLGYLKKQIKISEKSTFITVVLEEESIEMLGALNSNKRYKSKRPKQ